MQYILPVHELYALAYLTHEHGAGALRQNEVFVDDALEQLTACYPAKNMQVNFVGCTILIIFKRKYHTS